VAAPWARSSGSMAGVAVAFDGCLAYQKRGTTVCANHLVVRMDRIDEAVLTTIGGDVLKPKIIPAVIAA
jgi:hypothetical protein